MGAGWLATPWLNELITELTRDHLPLAQELLTEGFSQRDGAFWRRSLERLAQHPGNPAAQVPLGHLVWSRGEAVGAALTPASLRRGPDGRALRYVNLSCWYLREGHRWRLAGLLKHMLARPDSVFCDLTATPDMAQVLRLHGFRPTNDGVFIEFLPACVRMGATARLQAWSEQRHPERAWVAAGTVAHAVSLGHQAWVLHDDEGLPQLLVFKPKRIRGLRGLLLVYADSLNGLRRHRGVLARALVRRGHWLLESECRQEPTPAGAWHRPRDIGYVRGCSLGDRVDVLGTECSLFDLT